MSFVVG